MGDDVDSLIGGLKLLTVPGAEPADKDLDLSDVSTFEDAKFRVAEYFDKDPAIREVNLVFAGRLVGVATRENLSRKNVMLGDSQVGVGEGMQLPGFSTRYRLLKFTCPHCKSEYRIHYDERDIPVCNHGQMELQP